MVQNEQFMGPLDVLQVVFFPERQPLFFITFSAMVFELRIRKIRHFLCAEPGLRRRCFMG